MRSESTSAFGQPSETKPTFGGVLRRERAAAAGMRSGGQKTGRKCTVPAHQLFPTGSEDAMTSHYEIDDLKKFGDIGKHGKEHADLFFKYYGAVTGQDGALTKREKALIALAVAHSEKCPYCIDAYTTGALEAGANPAQ